MSDPVIRLNAALEGRYAIERELGEGGMAEDLWHHRKVAVKVLLPERIPATLAGPFKREHILRWPLPGRLLSLLGEPS